MDSNGIISSRVEVQYSDMFMTLNAYTVTFFSSDSVTFEITYLYLTNNNFPFFPFILRSDSQDVGDNWADPTASFLNLEYVGSDLLWNLQTFYNYSECLYLVNDTLCWYEVLLSGNSSTNGLKYLFSDYISYSFVLINQKVGMEYRGKWIW